MSENTKAAVLFSVAIHESAGGGNRVIMTDASGNLHLAKMSDEQLNRQVENVTAELSIDVQKGADLAVAILSQSPRAMTEPGAIRTLATLVVVLGNRLNEPRAKAPDDEGGQ